MIIQHCNSMNILTNKEKLNLALLKFLISNEYKMKHWELFRFEEVFSCDGLRGKSYVYFCRWKIILYKYYVVILLSKERCFFFLSCRCFALKKTVKENMLFFFSSFFFIRMSSTRMKMCHRCCWTSSTLDISTRGTRAAWSKSFSLEKPDILLYLAPLLMVTGGNVTT